MLEAETTVFRIKSVDADAVGEYVEPKFLVREGSIARKNYAPSGEDTVVPVHERLQHDGIITEHEGKWRFTQDHLFSSPSGAAAAVMGRTANGWIEWKTDDGLTLQQAYRPVDSADMQQTFANFATDGADQIRVLVRQRRAEQIRELLSNPATVDLEMFNRDVWAFETSTLLHGKEIKGELFSDQVLTPEFCKSVRNALESNQIELHGNYAWGSGTHTYGPMLKISNDEKLEHVRTVVEILNSTQIPPLEKSKQIQELPGFGHNMATGLVMLFHPDQFAIYNKPSKSVLVKLGYTAGDLATFQSTVSKLREEWGAKDFLELDWFLYKLSLKNETDQSSITGPADEIPSESSDKKFWAISLGEGGRLWPECYKNEIIAIGWDKLGDLQQYDSREEIEEALKKNQVSESNPTNNSKACYQFANVIKPGDMVFVKKGRGQLFGAGVVQSDYQYEPMRSEYRNTRKVQWLLNGHWDLPDDAQVPLKTLTNVTQHQAFLDFALPLIQESEDVIDDQPDTEEPKSIPPYTIDKALEGIFISENYFKEILDALARKKNIILQGPPGCGKTFISKRIAYSLIGTKDPSKVTMIQFHQSYSYEDFIQGWRPTSTGGFELRNGVFYEFCRRAEKDEQSNYVFVIDEINRGNLSKIFGELLMLIEADKRGNDFGIPLTYAKNIEDTFSIPENVHLIGMMNTADRSLAMVDYALRRRFTFLDLTPQFASEDFRSFLDESGVDQELIEMIVVRMSSLNEVIRGEKTNLGPGFEIGHSFFCPQGSEEDLGGTWYQAVIRSEIAPLLREYWFDDLSKAEAEIAKLLQ